MLHRILCVLLVALTNVLVAQTEVVPGVHVIPGAFVPGTQPDGNSIFLDAPAGLIVIDTGRHVTHTQRILDFAKARKRPIAAVVNTHWHLDHIGGNAVIRRDHPNVRVYASGALNDALTGFLANYRKQLEEMLKDPKTSGTAADVRGGGPAHRVGREARRTSSSTAAATGRLPVATCA